ncbi:MAG: hypothetical protein ABFS86_17355, partial [Planctomycetota bacterium]
MNSAPPALVAGLTFGGVLRKPLLASDTELTLVDGSEFPKGGGLVRVGSELVRYAARDGGVLSGLVRGVRAGLPWHPPGSRWRSGTLVCAAAAWEIATRPLRARPGEFEAHESPECARRIAELGTTALDREEFERTWPFFTCWSGRVVGSGWCNARRLLNDLDRGIGMEEGPAALRLSNPRYFGPGTIVRITDGRNVDYGMVETNDGVTVQLVNRVRHDYEADRATVEALARHPVNVNTASEEVLVACLTNLCLRASPGDVVTGEEARALAVRIREKPIERLFHLEALLSGAVDEGVISAADHRAIYLNALNPCDRTLAVSTAPLGFRSFDTVTAHATAVLCSKAGIELARKSLTRVVSVHPGEASEWRIDRQTHFEEHLIASRDGRYTTTYPYNTGAHHDGDNLPPSRYSPHVLRNIWPSAKSGDVRLAPERLEFEDAFHYDDSRYPGGHYVDDAPLLHSIRDRRVDLMEDDLLGPVSFGFWVQPFTNDGTAYIVDCGQETWRNRIAVFRDGRKNELVLQVADGTLTHRAAEIRCPIDEQAYERDTWYHVGVDVLGSKPGDLSLRIDGRPVGEAAYRTRLTRRVSATPAQSEDIRIDQLLVESTKGFPSHGAVVIRGEQGTEVFEYDRAASQSFRVTRRYARLDPGPLDDMLYMEAAGWEHEPGAVVELLGYSSPLLSDAAPGGGELIADLARPHALRVCFAEDSIYLSLISEGVEVRGIAPDRAALNLVLGSTVKAYDPEIGDEESFNAFSPSGYAILFSWGPFRHVAPGVTIGGREIVYYEKSDNTLRIRRYQQTRQVEASKPYFVPQCDYGSPDAVVGMQQPWNQVWGLSSVLIPISVEVTGGEYLDVTEDEKLAGAYAQIEDEWLGYTYADSSRSGGLHLIWDDPRFVGSAEGWLDMSRWLVVRPQAGEGGEGGEDEDDEGPDPEPPAPPDGSGDDPDGGPPVVGPPGEGTADPGDPDGGEPTLPGPPDAPPPSDDRPPTDAPPEGEDDSGADADRPDPVEPDEPPPPEGENDEGQDETPPIPDEPPPP